MQIICNFMNLWGPIVDIMYVHNTKAWRSVKILYTLPLAKPAQAKVQMLTTFSCIVKLIPWNLVNPSHLYKKESSEGNI